MRAGSACTATGSERAIQQLEISPKVTLFARSERPVSLTPAGEALLGEGRDLLDRAHCSIFSPEGMRRLCAMIDEGLPVHLPPKLV